MIDRVTRRLRGGGLGATVLRALVGSAGLRILGMGFGFLVGVQLARGLGARGMGEYGMAMALIAIATVPSELGLPQLLTREIAGAHVRGDGDRIVQLMRWADRVTVIVALAGAPVAVAAALLLRDAAITHLEAMLAAGLVLVPAVALASLRGASLRGLQKVVLGQVPDAVVRPAVFSGLLLVGSAFGVLDAAMALALGAAAAFVALGVGEVFLRRLLPPARKGLPALEQGERRGLLRSAFPMALTEGMRVLQGHVSVLLLGILAASSAVGIYRVASSTVLLVSAPLTVINLVGAPLIARLHAAGDRARLQRLLPWLAVAMSVSTAILTIPFALAGDRLLVVMFGGDFAASRGPLLVLSGGVVACSLLGGPAAVLNMTGKEARVTRASALSCVVLIVASLPLIDLFGELGAAWASVGALFVWTFVMWWDASGLLNLDTSVFALLRRGPLATREDPR